MKTLKQFKEEHATIMYGYGMMANRFKRIKDGGKTYLVAFDFAPGYGWCALCAERADGKSMNDDELNIGAFGRTYGDCVDSLFWR